MFTYIITRNIYVYVLHVLHITHIIYISYHMLQIILYMYFKYTYIFININTLSRVGITSGFFHFM